MSKDLGNALRKGREANSFSQQQVADALGVSRAAVGQWERGTNAPSTENLVSICKLLGLDIAAVLSTAGVMPIVAPDGVHFVETARPPSQSEFANPKSIPLFSPVFATPAGDFALSENASELARKPTGLGWATGSYAIYVGTNVMAPRYEIGEMIVLSPTRPARIGDHVAVQMPAEEGRRPLWRLGRLSARDAQGIVLEQFNPARLWEMRFSEVANVHRILSIEELL